MQNVINCIKQLERSAYLAYFWKPISLGIDRGRMISKEVKVMVNLRSVYQCAS